jgi:hypothetical protein
LLNRCFKLILSDYPADCRFSMADFLFCQPGQPGPFQERPGMTTPSAKTLPAEMAAQLAQLRDIHHPDPISWWPLAPGWWALAVLLLVCSALVIVFEIRRRRSLKYRALREFDLLRSGTARMSA